MLHRRPLVKTLLERRPDHLLAVSSLGSATWDLSAAGDDPRNFCFIGAMGQAAPFALGLALAQPDKRVVLFAGDGDMLMSLGALATIAVQKPSNLAVLVMDNGAYVETGGQPTATAGPTNLEAVARGCGIAAARTVSEAADIAGLRETMLSAPGPVFVNVRIAAEPLPLVFPHSFDGAEAVNRFRGAATENRAAHERAAQV